MRLDNYVRRDSFINGNGVVWEKITYADGSVKVFEKEGNILREIGGEGQMFEASPIPEVMIKDKVDYIAGHQNIYSELTRLQSALKSKEDEWAASILKTADKAFGEASELLLTELKARNMEREGDIDLFRYLRDKFILTLSRRLRD